MIRPFRCAAWLALTWLLLVAPAMAEPALWVVKGKSATVYLFGTMHVLPRRATWLSQKIRAAFDRSDTLWEEADVEVDDPKAVQHMLGLGMAPAGDLFATLPPAYATAFRAQVVRCGLSVDVVAHFRPWFASMVVPMECALKAGDGGQVLQPGPETVFLRLAKTAGKPLQFFETADQQFGFLSGASPQSQVQQLEHAIDEATDTRRAVLGAMESAWLAGDEAALLQQVDPLRRDDQPTYQTLFVERNHNFAAKIEQLLAGEAICFVAVGVGHLVGPDSVVEELKKHGFAPHRI
jgi:uncharacterized protein YbaP (TraB family)